MKRNRRRNPGQKHRCPTGKRRFRDHQEAVSALGQARARRHIAANSSDHRRQESRTYFCSRCRGYHLTSQQDRYSA